MYSYQKRRVEGIKYNVEKFDIVLLEIGKKEACWPKEELETKQTLPLLVGNWGKTLTALVVGMRYPTLYVC